MKRGLLVKHRNTHVHWVVLFVLTSGAVVCVTLDGNFSSTFEAGEVQVVDLHAEVFRLIEEERQ